MRATTPEELETLLEDAFVTRDRTAVASLFEDAAVLDAEPGAPPARGGPQIAQLASRMWERGRGYLAEPRRVLQARDTALVVSDGAIGVMRRASDGSWRYAIALLTFEDPRRQEER